MTVEEVEIMIEEIKANKSSVKPPNTFVEVAKQKIIDRMLLGKIEQINTQGE